MKLGSLPKLARYLSGMPASRVLRLTVVAISFANLVGIARALPLPQRAQPPRALTLVAGERWLPTVEESWITFHLATPEKVSIREQYLNQEVLAQLLLYGAGQRPSSRLCNWRIRRGDVFGDFSIGARHASLARRLECLRGVVDHLLWQTISEEDFRSTAKDKGYWALYGWPTYIYAQPMALLKIYEKYSPLYQIHSVGQKDFSELSFDEFNLWLRISRERKLITFYGKSALLDFLGLSVPDPMVLRQFTSLKSLRVPAGILFFDSEHLGVSALIMVSLDPRDPKPLDPQIGGRLACDTSKPSRLGAGSVGGTITSVFCDTSFLFGDVWLALAVAKLADASYQDFCREVQELTKDTDVAALVRGSPEGSKGLYILLPTKCEPHK
jgi:hypothetical protein